MLHLLPDNAREAREEIDDPLLLFLARPHLHLVHGDAPATLHVFRGLAIEKGYVVVANHIPGAGEFHDTGSKARRWNPALYP